MTRSWVDQLDVIDRHDLVLVLTLLLMAIHPLEYWYVRAPLTVLAVAGLAFAPLRTSSSFWFAIATFWLAGCYRNWLIVDNHKFLTAYWCLAVAISLALAMASPSTQGSSTQSDQRVESERLLQHNARWLIGLSFAFAVFAKAFSHDFRDASFFELTLLTDSRFATVAQWLGGLSSAELTQNRQYLSLLTSGIGVADGATLNASSRVEMLATGLTWWTLIIETLIAIAFVAPARTWIGRTRDAWLLLFAFTTYAVASVVGFGWVLVIMGYAQCGERVRRRLYLVALALVELYTMPWGQVISPLFVD